MGKVILVLLIGVLLATLILITMTLYIKKKEENNSEALKLFKTLIMAELITLFVYVILGSYQIMSLLFM